MQRTLSRWTGAVPRYAFRGASALVAAPLAGAPALVQSQRTVASYPSPGVRHRRTKKKKYNFLTTSRLVPVERRKESRAAIRQRDDIGIKRRQQYRQQLQQDIEEKIHYLPPYLVTFIFYPKVRNLNKRKIFTGNRMLAVRTFTRVYVYVMDQLLEKDNRKALCDLIQEGGLNPPTAAMLKPYLNPRTGAISNIGIFYSTWMKRRLEDTWIRLNDFAAGNVTGRKMTPIVAYLARYHADLTKVPSLQQWYDAIGPLREEELVGFSKSLVNVHRALLQAKREVEVYGRDLVEQAVQALTMQEESELIQYVITHAAEIVESMRRAHLVSSLVLFGINRLPETRAIQTPSRVHLQEEACKWAVQHDGRYSPRCPSRRRDWLKMSAEQRASYYCFKRKMERRANTGSQLYVRLCVRDYGLPKSDALKRFAQLSDLQQAAVNFPFYYSIAPRNGATVAFRHFYLAMCQRYGLTRGTGNSTFGNRLFEAAMRKKWHEMDADERHQYFESDAIRASFPLLPPSASSTRRGTSDDDPEDGVNGGDDNDDDSYTAVRAVGDDDVEMASTADLAVKNAKATRRRRVDRGQEAKTVEAPPRTKTGASRTTDDTSQLLYASSGNELVRQSARHGAKTEAKPVSSRSASKTRVVTV